MSERFSRTELFERWETRWEEFLNRIDSGTDPGTVAERLRDKVTIGNAERRLAGGHEGREILELLQNARDAIRANDPDQGRVYVGVHDKGVLVANTGEQFDLFDSEVEEAVTMIGETAKANNDSEHAIGHKGIGLKSILSTGDAFEIWTRPEEPHDDILRVRLSRAYLVNAILTHLGQETNFAFPADDVSRSAIGDLIQQQDANSSTSRIDLTSTLTDRIRKLPLFNFPLPLVPDAEHGPTPVTNRAKELLHASGTESTSAEHIPKKPYRTAVFIEYRDQQWRELLSEVLGVDPPDEETGDVENRAERIWQHIARSEGTDGLRPETIVQLGEIDELHLERLGDDAESLQSERWCIDRDTETDTAVSGLTHHDVTVSIQSTTAALDEGGATETETIDFDQFTLPNGGDHHVRLLVDQLATDQSLQEYPLYLYYPIRNTMEVPLPFCLHGRFKVQTNRKDLSEHHIDTNKDVLAEGITLISRAAAETARSNDYDDIYPWIFLPPVPDERRITDQPTTQTELLHWFCTTLYDKLQQTACIPAEHNHDARQPDNILLHWKPAILNGFYASQQIISNIEQLSYDFSSTVQPLPAHTHLDAYLTQFNDWEPRLQRLIHDAAETVNPAVALLDTWTSYLGDHLQASTEGPALHASTDPAHQLLRGTIQLIRAAADESDKELETVIENCGDDLNGVYLLPSQLPENGDGDNRVEQHSTDEILLVKIEQRESPDRTRQQPARSRSVIWNVKSDGDRTADLRAVPQDAAFTVYFLDERVEEFAANELQFAGRAWGVREYDGIPSYIRSLLDTFAFEEGKVDAASLAFLASYISEISEESKDLQAGEGSFLPQSYLKSAITQTEGEQRLNLRRRLKLRHCRLTLPGVPDCRIRDGYLIDAWQRLRANAKHGLHEDEELIEDWDATEATGSTPSWPDPDADTWNSVQKRLQNHTKDVERANAQLAATLSLLGATSLPGIRVVWPYGAVHPSMQDRYPPWNPVEWDAEVFDGSVPDRVEHLQDALQVFEGAYQQWITSAEQHPAETVDHTQQCPVKTDRILGQVHLSSWVWFDDIDEIKQLEDSVPELMKRHGEALADSLLRTGWTCDHSGGNRRSWSEPLPTLLNWQLRHLPVWNQITEIHEDVADDWHRTADGADSDRLSWAIIAGSSSGAQAARLFPRVDPEETALSEELFETLGVKSIDAFTATEAAYRLQKLQEVLAGGNLGKDPEPLEIPSERENDWYQAYTNLLKPIMQRLPASDDDGDADERRPPQLTHLPLQKDGGWWSVPVAWIKSSAADKVRRYPEQSAKPWERREMEDKGYYQLTHPSEGPFARLADYLDVEPVDAPKPVFNEADLDLVGEEEYASQLERFRQELSDRQTLLIAAMERTQEDDIQETATDLAQATDHLAVARSFPEDEAGPYSDRASGIYEIAEDVEALVFNEEAIDKQELELEDLAPGIALLVERPTKIATFREALDAETDPEMLRDQWEYRTFPIKQVEGVLRSQERQKLERNLRAIVALIDMTGGSPPSVDAALETVPEEDTAVITELETALCSGVSDTADVIRESSQLATLVREVRTELPDQLHFVLERLFGTRGVVDSWQDELTGSLDAALQQTVIEWLLDHADMLPTTPVAAYVEAQCGRLVTIYDILQETANEELRNPVTWKKRSDELGRRETVNWTHPVSDDISSLSEVGLTQPWFFFADEDKLLSELVDPVLNRIEREVDPGDETQLRDILLTFVKDGDFPVEDETTTNARDYQEEAFDSIARSVTTGDVLSFAPDVTAIDVSNQRTNSLSISTGSGSGGGGGSQYKGRGQQAEAYTMAAILDEAAERLANGPDGQIRQFTARFRSLKDEQEDTKFKWHVKSKWDNGILDIVDSQTGLNASSLQHWRDQLGDNRSLTDLPFIKLINVTMEQGPGFDVIDPFGPLHGWDKVTLTDPAFTPVEVKAVDDDTPPFNFRLTTNEFRRCRAFVEQGNKRYAIRLVYIPETSTPDTPDWPQQASIVNEIVIDDIDDLIQRMEGTPFDEVVKGGYMNMEIN